MIREEKRNLTSFTSRTVLVIFILLIASFYLLRSIYIPIFVSYFLAFLLNPLVRGAEKRGFGRVGPTLMLLTLVFALLLGFVLLMVPKLLGQLNDFVNQWPTYMNTLSARITPYSVRYFGYDIFTEWQQLARDLLPKLAVPATGMLESLVSGTMKALSVMLTTLMIPLMTFYILKDYYRFNQLLLQLVPRRHLSDFEELIRRLSRVLGTMIRGQFLVCILLAGYYSIALSAVGVEMSLILGIFSGMMNLVPFIGPLVSLIFAVSFAWMGGGAITQCIAILGIYLVANLVDSAVLTPKIVGKQIGISPLVIILTLLAGAELLGFLGVLIALPMMAMVKVLGGFFVERYFASSYYQDGGLVKERQGVQDEL